MLTQIDIVNAARLWLGTPYQHQASLRGVGCDCLGLLRGVWRDTRGAEPEVVPAYTPDWASSSRAEALAQACRRHLTEISVDELEAGDVLLFRLRSHLAAKHTGIATTSTSMIHAQDGAVVSEVSLAPWWRARLAFAFRFPGVTR